VTAAEFAEMAIHFHGAVGLVSGRGLFALVRVTAVSFDDRGARLSVEQIATPGLPDHHNGGWDVFSIWEYLNASPTRWHQYYPVEVIEFDSELIDAVVAFAATLPPEFSPDNYTKLREFMSEFQNARRDTSAGES
jgi:hypothetical protein